MVRGAVARVELAGEVAEGAVALGDDVVAVDRLEVLLARLDEGVVAELAVSVDDLADHLADAVLDEVGVGVGLLDDGALVGALHELVDLAHRGLDDAEELAGVEVAVGALGDADVEGADAALVVGGDRDGVEDVLDCSSVKPPPARRSRAASRTMPWAQGQAVMPWARTPVRVRVPRSEATAVPKRV